MEEQDLPPGGVTNFTTSLRELQLLRRYSKKTLKPSDMLEFGQFMGRAAEWFESFHRGANEAAEQPRQPA